MQIAFDIDFTPATIALLGVMAVCFLILIFIFRRRVAMVSRRVAGDNDSPLPESAEAYPGVSVIVYSEDDAGNLETLLPQILEQDYPAPFEVIVVNDGGGAATKDVIARLEQQYPNLYMTFTPDQSRALSRKKLAITLGIKAARYDTVVHTMGHCRIDSATWLRYMCRHFITGKEVVIGYTAPRFAEETGEGPWRRLHAFDRVRTAVEYLSSAILGHPYRGSACNIAYKSAVFFKNKGFSRSLNLKYGDDDVFISEIATGRNTAVELSTASIVEEMMWHPQHDHAIEKMRHTFTACECSSHGTRLQFGLSSWAWWIFTGSTVALALCGLPSLIFLIAGCLWWILTAVALMVAWRKCSKALGSAPLTLTVPWFMLYEPAYNLYYYVKSKLKRKENLSWG